MLGASARSTQLLKALGSYFPLPLLSYLNEERGKRATYLAQIRREGRGGKINTAALVLEICVWPLTALQTHATCRFAPSLQRFKRRIGGGGGGRGRKGERSASCRGGSPEWLRGGSLVTGNANACDETCALSGVCCRRFTRASQVSPQQKGASDTSSHPTRARCTT